MLILLFCVLGVGGDGLAAPQVKTLAVTGTNLAYLEPGQGPTLVLVHGTLIDYRDWAAQMDPFAERYRVIAVSLRHHYPPPATDGQSDSGLRVHAADVAARIRTLAVQPVPLVGHS
jgi:esterase